MFRLLKSEDEIHVMNGNYFFSINTSTGTKRRALLFNEVQETIPTYPENMDLKITDYCTANCPFCHEGSTTKGKHADVEWLDAFADSFPGGIEIAIGGGDPISHPHFVRIVEKLSERNIPSVTVNLKTITTNFSTLEDAIPNLFGVGISVSSEKEFLLTYKKHQFLKKLFTYEHSVIHLIAGVWDAEGINRFVNAFIKFFGTKPKVLILGYKNFGRGKMYLNLYPQVKNSITSIRERLMDKEFIRKFKVLSFDNLALHQLNVKRAFPDEYENSIAAPDGLFTMYVDAVNKEAAIASYCEERIPMPFPSVEEVFQKVREKALTDEGKIC